MFSELGVLKLKFLLMVFVLSYDGNLTFVKFGGFDSPQECKEKMATIEIKAFQDKSVDRAWHGCFTKEQIVGELNAR